MPQGALQQTGEVIARSWLLELPVAGLPVPHGPTRCEVRIVGAKFVKLDGPVALDGGLSDADFASLELEELLIVMPAVCVPFDAGRLAAVDYVSVAFRSPLGVEMPGDVACMKASPPS